MLLLTTSQYKLYKNVLNEKQFRYMKRWHSVEILEQWKETVAAGSECLLGRYIDGVVSRGGTVGSGVVW